MRAPSCRRRPRRHGADRDAHPLTTDTPVPADPTGPSFGHRVSDVTGVHKKSGALKRPYGKVARVGGKAVRQRLSSGVYYTVTSATISSTGRFSFGFRTVSTGKNRVITLADATWGQGSKVFLI